MPLQVALVRDPVALDPARISDNESMQVVSQIYDTLVRVAHLGGEVRPGLAEAWSRSPDSTVWTFQLRRGVRFHDGSPLTAAAVVYSFRRQFDPTHGGYRPDFGYWRSNFGNIRSVDAPNPATVRLTTDPARPLRLSNLALFSLSIVNPKVAGRGGAGLARDPRGAGTGPYRFVSWKNGRIHLERNPLYWGDSPAQQELDFEVITDPAQRLMGLESGRVDLAFGLRAGDRPLVRLNPVLQLYQRPGNNVAYLALNTRRPPFHLRAVRRAFNHAVNRTAVVKLVYQNAARPAHTPIPPALPSHNADVQKYAFDPQRARAMLDEAWPAPRRKLRLYLPSAPRPYLPQPVLAARIIQRNLAAVGVEVELVVLPFPRYRRATQQGEHDLCLAGWTGDNADPHNFLHTLLDRDNAGRGLMQNQAMFEDAELHSLLQRARSERNEAARLLLYREAQALVAREAPWVPLAHGQMVVAATHELTHFSVGPAGAVHYNQLTLGWEPLLR